MMVPLKLIFYFCICYNEFEQSFLLKLHKHRQQNMKKHTSAFVIVVVERRRIVQKLQSGLANQLGSFLVPFPISFGAKVSRLGLLLIHTQGTRFQHFLMQY